MQALAKILLITSLIVATCSATALRQSTTYTMKAGTCFAVELGFPVSFSSVYSADWAYPYLDERDHSLAPLTSCWVAARNSGQEWVQVTSAVPVAWTGVIIQGRPDVPQWVTQFSVSYSSDGRVWTDVDDGKAFNGNTDQNSKVTVTFSKPVIASTLRIRPTAWYIWTSMRFDATFQRLA